MIPIEDERVSIVQGDGVNPDNILIFVSEEAYCLKATSDYSPSVEYNGQTKTRLFAHKVWMEF